jgi:hypothetical protein
MLASSHSPLTFRDTIRTFAETEVQARLGREIREQDEKRGKAGSEY